MLFKVNRTLFLELTSLVSPSRRGRGAGSRGPLLFHQADFEERLKICQRRPAVSTMQSLDIVKVHEQ